MREMKDSGIEWIGEIPKDWNLSKIGAVYDERNTKVSDVEYQPLSVTKLGIVPQLETAAKTDNGDNRKLIKKNDFVINSRSDRRGSCGISEYDGSCSLINTVLKPRNNMCNKYYSFVFRSERFADEFYRWGNGIVDDLWSTKWSNMKRIYIPQPSITEQERLADYLDKKCSQIDEVIRKQEKVIEKLKEYRLSVITEAVTKGLNPNVEMKDSGIEWIGEIPRDWQVARLKYFSSVKTGPFGTQLSANEYVDEGIPCINVKNLGSGIIKAQNLDFLPKSVVKRLSEHKLKENDIVFARKGSIDKHAIVSNKEAGWLQGSDCIRLRVNEKINPRYVNYYIESSCVKNYLNLVSNGATMASLSGGMIENIYIGFPDKAVQNDIVRSLDCKCNRIDIVLEERMKLIKKFKEIKNSIIYEVVTGKREV